MNDDKTFERDVAEAFDRESPGRPVPDAIHDDLLTYAGRTRQQPTWLASLTEPPMRQAGSLAVGSPTVRAAAILVATLLFIVALVGAGLAGQRLLAFADPVADHVVDRDGTGDFITITDAVAAAEDGETILIRDGTYAESVTIDRDIRLFGESRDGVIIEFGAGCTLRTGTDAGQSCPSDVRILSQVDVLPPGPFALNIVDSAASVSDLTIRHLSYGFGLYISGGSPTVERVTFADNTRGSEIGRQHVMLRGGTSATIRDSDFGNGSIEIAGASPVTLERNALGAILP